MGRKICLIDDEKDFTELTGALLRFNGFDPFTVNDPQEGLSHLKQEPFDAVVVDLMMPDMDGFSLIENIRSLEPYRKTPLFVLSCKELSDEERKFLLVHKTHFIAKPFDPRRLVELLISALG